MECTVGPSGDLSAGKYFDNVNASALRAASVMVERRLVGLVVVVKAKLAGTRNVASIRHFLDSKHNESHPRSNAPYMPVVRVFGKEIINEVIGDPLWTRTSKFVA